MPGSRSDLSKTIALNAGLILHTAGVVDSIKEGFILAGDLIENGDAWKQLLEFTSAAKGNVAFLKTLPA